MDSEIYSFKFDARKYPNSKFSELNKMPVDTFNRIQSAINRFNEVKNPTGNEPSDEEKDYAWDVIKRSAQTLEIPLYANSWKDLDKFKAYKNIKNDEGMIMKINRSFNELDEEGNKQYFIEGSACSNNFDDFKTRLSDDCLQSLARQINDKSGTPFSVILESTHEGDWNDNLGIVSEAIFVESPEIGFPSTLMIRAKLDPAHPMSMYLYNILQREESEFITPFIGLSNNGYVTDWDFDKAYLSDEEYNDLHEDFSIYDFKFYEGYIPIVIYGMQLEKIAITNRPSNPDTFVNAVKRSIGNNMKSGNISILRSKESNILEGENTMTHEQIAADNAPIEETHANDVSTEVKSEEVSTEVVESTTEKVETVAEEVTANEEVVVNVDEDLNKLTATIDELENPEPQPEPQPEQETNKESLVMTREQFEILKNENIELIKVLREENLVNTKRIEKLTNAVTRLTAIVNKTPIKRAIELEDKDLNNAALNLNPKKEVVEEKNTTKLAKLLNKISE